MCFNHTDQKILSRSWLTTHIFKSKTASHDEVSYIIIRTVMRFYSNLSKNAGVCQSTASENVQSRVTRKLFYKSYVLLMRLSAFALPSEGRERKNENDSTILWSGPIPSSFACNPLIRPAG